MSAVAEGFPAADCLTTGCRRVLVPCPNSSRRMSGCQSLVVFATVNAAVAFSSGGRLESDDARTTGEGHFSPDAKFLVYKSDESGQGQIYVQPVPSNGSKWQVSKAGGADPAWRRDGKEIFYIAPDQKLMAVPVKTEPAFETGTPQILFEAGNGAYVPSLDGQRFLVVVPAGGEAA